MRASFRLVLSNIFRPIFHLIVRLVRNLLGALIALLDVLTRGSKLTRQPQAQKEAEEAVKALTLYQFFACPFCIKTRRAMYKMNLPIAKRSVSEGSPYREELLLGGGKIQTPCLRIESAEGTKWLYESSQIIAYLEQRFAQR
ncbi:glutathione S-transferase N-terminal domain-containing protein [Glaciecola siphonariae]|uniref:Glutathione S-transferase N-terminal domain-containing protein n=1 Tax=Glaciecola siphonariae TaxID=521012 RepID=A0ABV9LTA4_9ALTE